jgi:hypothetical protein
MLYRETIAVCSEIHTKHKYSCVCKVKEIGVKRDGTVRILTAMPYSGPYCLQFDWQLRTCRLMLPLAWMAVSLANKNLVF